jgi:hypothetical protein
VRVCVKHLANAKYYVGLAFYSHVDKICVTASFYYIREEVWAHKTSLPLPLFIEVPVPRQES